MLAFLGAPFLCCRRYFIAIGLLAAATFWIGLCSTPAFATWLLRGLEHPYAQITAASYPRVDAIVVLGGGKLPQPGVAWGTANTDVRITRLGFGLQLLRSSRASVMLVSGDDQALQMAQKLREQGVPASVLITEAASSNTYENALYSALILKQRKLQRILLVTSRIHMSRAQASFERQGLTVIPAPAPDPFSAPRHPGYSWWPGRAALRVSAACLREYMGLWGYRLRGWA